MQQQPCLKAEVEDAQPLCTLTDSLLQMWTTEWVRGRECSPEGMARRSGTSAIISKFELGHDRPVRES
jgi:Zn ribbon nucleic-acid-binding protein